MLIFWLNYFLICIIYYLIGSIPFSYIIVRFRHKVNIIESGTGNAGAMNAYEVTNSKHTGILVLIFDFLKGILPTIFLIYVLNLSMKLCFVPLVLLVFGHNFSIWLKFKGGRGLATSAGIYSGINFLFVIIWLLIYFISHKIKKDVHIANIFATILLPIIIIIFQNYLLRFNYNYFDSNEYSEFFIIFSCLISMIILIKHIEPLILYFKKTK